MGKAKLPELQSAGTRFCPSGKMLRPEIWSSLADSKKATNFPTRRYPNEGDNGRTEALKTDRTDLATKGSPNGGNTQGDRVLIVAQRLG